VFLLPDGPQFGHDVPQAVHLAAEKMDAGGGGQGAGQNGGATERETETSCSQEKIPTTKEDIHTARRNRGHCRSDR